METSNSRSVGAAWKSLLGHSGLRHGGGSSLMVHLLVIAAFGLLVPWWRGLDFFDPIVVLSYSAIAFLFASAAVTQLMAQDPARAIPAVIASGLHGWSLLAVTLLLGIATVNLTFRAPRLLHPNWKLLGASLLLALAGALFLAALGAMLSVVFSPSAARNSVRFGFLLVLLGFVVAPGRLPVSMQSAINDQLTTAGLTRLGFVLAGASAVLAAGLLYALRAKSRTSA